MTRFCFYGRLDIAKRHYSWVKDQRGATTPNGHCMVAVFWDPITQTIYASSVPLGPRKSEIIIISSKNGAATSWYSQVRTLINVEYWRKPAIHAEDARTSTIRRMGWRR